MSVNDQNEAILWIQNANNDLVAADRLITLEPFILDIACFHCQQAIEKALKAFLKYQKENVGRTHNLNFLINQCIKQNSEFARFDLRPFAVFAVDIRYPDSSINPKIVEVK